MKKIIILAVMASIIAVSGYTQSNTDSEQLVFEVLYILPVKGMEDKFEDAVKAHNQKFHQSGPYMAGLRKIEYGEQAGWYVWVMGPTAYSTLDTPLGNKDGHSDDWTKTVDPLTSEYGYTGLWNYNADLSYGMDIFMKAKHYETWGVDLQKGEYYRFKALAEKLKKTYESIGKTAFVVVENTLHQAGGPDVAFIWSFDTFSDWQKDPGPKATFEKIYGAGSWQTMLEEWKDIVVDYNSEIRSNIN